MENHQSQVILCGSGWESEQNKCFHIRRVLEAYKPEDVIPVLQQVSEETGKGFTAVGFAAYEAAAAFGLPVHGSKKSAIPLCWFGIVSAETREQWNISSGNISPASDSQNSSIANLKLNQTESQYYETLASLKSFIERGDSYQVNYTLRASFQSVDDEIGLFQSLYHNQAVPYAALIQTPEWQVLSLSPELFLQKKGRLITSRPMKGTHRRGRFPAEDKEFMQRLQQSEKDRAENIMIVDMVRNDLGKICEFGSVHAKDEYQIESYRTVLQMTSSVNGLLKQETRLEDVFQAAFPAASITGAPKHRTMDIIRQHETVPRGVYCGAVGIVRPSGDFTFNVAIRTLTKTKKDCHYTLGTGGGILWDSIAEKEFQEIQTKTKFLTYNAPDFQLIETMKYEADGGLLYLEEHIDRMESSAAYFDFKFNRASIVDQILQWTLELQSICAVRVLLDSDGKCTLSTREITSIPSKVKIKLSSQTVDSYDPFFFHKTTHRGFYNKERELALNDGFFEVLFQNEQGSITEGSITNIFIRQDGSWYTPPVTDGLLAGIWRMKFIEKHHARETSVTPAQLKEADEIVIGNSVMGTVKVDELLLT